MRLLVGTHSKAAVHPGKGVGTEPQGLNKHTFFSTPWATFEEEEENNIDLHVYSMVQFDPAES